MGKEGACLQRPPVDALRSRLVTGSQAKAPFSPPIQESTQNDLNHADMIMGINLYRL